jgi:hypothetical protein
MREKKVLVLDSGKSLFESVQLVPKSHIRTLLFNSDGTHIIESEYSEYMHTNENIIQEIPYYGIIGHVDLPFAKYLILVIKQQEIRINGIVFYRVLETIEFPICRNCTLSLDEEEYTRLCIRNTKQELTGVYYSFEYDLTRSLQEQEESKGKYGFHYVYNRIRSRTYQLKVLLE